ncbi:MAG: hypothetical protein H6745_28180 [Deltaproteobacteria bacterium]|nr:hypothetical protein [Deltaproteobacteria bacterium]
MRLHLARLVLTGVLASLTTLVAPPRATACSFPSNQQYELTTDASADTTPPTAPVAVDATVSRRGKAGDCGSSSSCDDLGVASIIVTTPGTDDQTASDDLGYRFELVSGKLPNGASLPNGTVSLLQDEEALIVWIDGRSDDQESFHAVVRVIPVDRAGNEGPGVEVRLGDEGSGCQAGGRELPPNALFIALALLVLTLRRARLAHS